ncbi:hypothetical protein DJ047_12365 [Salmonella enterica]|nr:hypothetical protein [Salmonella enterica]
MQTQQHRGIKTMQTFEEYIETVTFEELKNDYEFLVVQLLSKEKEYDELVEKHEKLEEEHKSLKTEHRKMLQEYSQMMENYKTVLEELVALRKKGKPVKGNGKPKLRLVA